MKNQAIDFAFDDRAEAARQAAERMAAALVTNITAETEANIRALIAQAIRDGIPPYEAAALIQPLIGLTAAQGQAAVKYRAALLDGGLAPDAAEAKFQAYADELIDARAETIARTEIMDALNTGVDEAWAQAQDEGLLSAEAAKEVILTGDACDDCAAVADEGPVPIADDFSQDGPPFHPRCRCTVGIATP